MERMTRRHLFQLLKSTFVLACALLCVQAAGAAARPAKGQDKPVLPANPIELVRVAVNHEIELNKQRAYSAWKEKEVKPNGTSIKQIIETPAGVLGRYLAVNGHPLNEDERRKEDARLNRLLDPAKLSAKQKEQKEDEERTIKMLKAIPDAFLWEYAGNTPGPEGKEYIKLNFKPNPDFDPPTRESLVFEGMSGTMIIDPVSKNLVKIDGTLFRDVTIGWGIIGHLDKGGRFIVEQAEVYPGHWDQTRMVLDFTGKALIFKTIKIKEDTVAYDFKPIGPMNLQQALQYLKEQDQSAVASLDATKEASKAATAK